MSLWERALKIAHQKNRFPSEVWHKLLNEEYPPPWYGRNNWWEAARQEWLTILRNAYFEYKYNKEFQDFLREQIEEVKGMPEEKWRKVLDIFRRG